MPFKRYFISSVFVLLLLLQLEQSTEAFKIIKFGGVRGTQSTAQNAVRTASSSATVKTVSTFDTGALLKGLNDKVSSKLNLFSSLANTVVQLKSNLLSTFASKWNHPNSIPTIFAKPNVSVTKTTVKDVEGSSGKHDGYTY